MILISSHLDRVKPDFKLRFIRGQHVGLLDNFVGVLLTYLVLYNDQNIQKLEQEEKVKVWHNQSEEWGKLDTTLPSLTKKDFALVVDVASSKAYNAFDVILENATITMSDLEAIKENLEWHGLKVLARLWNGNEDDEDESWYFRKLGIPTLSFTIPIKARNDGWHRWQEDNYVSSEQINKSIFALKRLINYLEYSYTK